METNPTEIQAKPKPIKRMVRFILRLFLFLIISFFTLLGVGVMLSYYYQDEVKEYVIAELNKQLNTQVIVDGNDIDFTVVRSFPMASINFKNIKALDAIESEHKDTLFNAEEISLQFSLIDLFKKNYKIKKIEISHSTVN
ncbi:MAG: hypothetical protein IPH89_14550 [Bacteroidetes bacterium]|nr:hypothetical protein [Bacteroidota bacterium]